MLVRVSGRRSEDDSEDKSEGVLPNHNKHYMYMLSQLNLLY